MTIEPRHEVEANAIINANTYGIVRESYDGPVEEVTGPLLARDIAAALAAADARGKVNGLREAVAKIGAKRKIVAGDYAITWPLIELTAEIAARIADLQAEKGGP